MVNCIKCGAPVPKNHICSGCGVDVRLYKKAYNTANYYYNCGLEKAQVRDLSGAIEDLKIALKYKKELTDARNLLGLVYYEMGEVVSALSEWVLSLHFQPEDNLAKEYVESIQNNPTKLEHVNQVVKKYNQTLTYARQNNEDMALIQLKKVLNLSPNFVAGHLLLALLYMKAGTPDKAKKPLEKVLKIDAHNIIALRYMNELNMSGIKSVDKVEETKKTNTNIHTKPVGKYKEPASGMHTFIYILVGAVIAAVAMWFLVIPSMNASIKESAKKKETTLTQELQGKSTALTKAEKKVKNLTSTNKKLQAELEKYQGDGAKSVYDKLLLASQYYSNNDRVSAAEQLMDIKEADLQTDVAKQVYQELSEDTLEYASQSLFSQAWNQYNAGQYDESLEIFTKSYKMNDQNVESLYFIARCYDRKGDTKKAKQYYNKIIADFPGTYRANKAQEYLRYLDDN